MRWPWKRKEQTGATEGRKAREAAEGALEDARKDTPEVIKLARALKAQRMENHFSQLILDALREER